MNTIKIACVGDVMCGDSFYAIGNGVASSLRQYGKDFLHPQIVRFLSSHDLVLCNVECALSDLGRKDNILRSVHMRGLPEAAKYLADWGIRVANVANNHIFEHGFDCAIDTVRRLNAVGIKTIGAGKDGLFKPGIQIIEVAINGQTVSLLGTCLRKERYAYSGGAELDEILDSISVLTSQGKTVIVSVHWGDELMDRPNQKQKDTAHQLARAGASLVIGHHPHVVQGIDSTDSNLIAYSLGNFIFDGNSEATGWSVILSITISGEKTLGWEAIPVIRDRDYRPILAQGEQKSQLQKEITRRCWLLNQQPIDTEKYQKEYVSELKSLESKSRRRLWLDIAKRFFRYKPIYWLQILFRPIQRRLGIW